MRRRGIYERRHLQKQSQTKGSRSLGELQGEEEIVDGTGIPETARAGEKEREMGMSLGTMEQRGGGGGRSGVGMGESQC